MKMKILIAVAVAMGVLVLLPTASWAHTTETCITANSAGGETFTVCYKSTATSITLDSVTSSGNGGATKVFAGAVYGAGATITASGFTDSTVVGKCSDGFSHSFTDCTIDDGGAAFPVTFNVASATSIVFHVGGFTPSCSAFISFGLNTIGSGSSTELNLTGGTANSGDCAAAVPEPGSMALLGSGLVGLAGLMRRRFFA